MMRWYGCVAEDNEMTMLKSSDSPVPGWVELPEGWTMPPRAPFDPPGPTPDKLVWDADTQTVSVQPRE